MKEQQIELINIGIDEFKKEIYSHYVKIFPRCERKPYRIIYRCYKSGYTTIIKIVLDDKIIGFMLLNRVKQNAYSILDYLAILPQYRNNGYGEIALKQLIEKERNTNGIFVEVDKVGLGKDSEENELRERRKNFYERVGFKKLDFDLILFNVVFMPYIFSNIEVDEQKVVDEIFEIYITTIGNKIVEKNCKIVK